MFIQIIISRNYFKLTHIKAILIFINIFQINQGKLHRGKAFNGFANVFFTNPHHKGNVQGKYKKGFKLGKCFVLRDNQISEIRGNFVNDELVVSFPIIFL